MGRWDKTTHQDINSSVLPRGQATQNNKLSPLSRHFSDVQQFWNPLQHSTFNFQIMRNQESSV